MARHARADDYEDDPEGLDAWDVDGDEGEDDADTVDCPHCGREISEYAEQCPRCGAYVSEEEATRTNFPWWVIVTAAVLLAGIAVGWLGGIF